MEDLTIMKLVVELFYVPSDAMKKVNYSYDFPSIRNAVIRGVIKKSICVENSFTISNVYGKKNYHNQLILKASPKD